MTDTLVLNNKTLHPIKEASQHVSYSKDYITRLAREGKIVARWVGRQWFIDVESLKVYAADAQAEQQLRQQRLSDERKRERELRNAHQAKAELHVAAQQQTPWRALGVVGLTAVGGLLVMGGLLTVGPVAPTYTPASQVANVHTTAPTTQPVAQVPAHAVQPHFAVAATSTMATSSGLVIVPSQTATLTEMFSDEVTSRERLGGGTELVLVDDSGVESVLPVVVIPVPDGTVIDTVIP